ncbi:MAG: hypothetical protein H7195_11000 [Chryseobacterium sp.]|nr:hypothetical protein [Chryseobacterium sp.]
MLRKLKISGLLIVTAFCFLSCNTTAQNKKNKISEIQSVTLTNTYGRGGTTTIKATKDSLISENNSIASKEIPTFKRKITGEEWNLILNSINLDKIKLTKSGKSQGYYDGPDEIFEISTKDKKYTLTNASDSTNYKQLKNLKVLLRNMVSQNK